MSGCNSVVECNLPKVDVAGSSPVVRFVKIYVRKYSKNHICAKLKT